MLTSLDLEGPTASTEFNEHPKTNTDVCTEPGTVRATLLSGDMLSRSRNSTVHRNCRILLWDGISAENISNYSYLSLMDAPFPK